MAAISGRATPTESISAEGTDRDQKLLRKASFAPSVIDPSLLVLKPEDVVEFKKQAHSDAVRNLQDDLRKLIATAAPLERESVISNCYSFLLLFQQYLSESGSKIDWSKIKPPPEGMIQRYTELPGLRDPARITETLRKVAVVKLNGGLGTSMGCVGPKSAITVREDLTFLDMCVQQSQTLHETYGVDVPLVLMNSFNTHKDTEKLLRKYKAVNCSLIAFNQSKFPRIFKEALRPMPVDCDNESEWYPPGHGDLYESLHQSGVLQKLIDEGKEWIFVSNIDNMGATVDNNILGYIDAHPECEFIMEVTDKTKADVKGGTLIDYEGTLRLLEVAQVAKDKLEEFKSIKKFKIFNTNNLWIKLSAIKRLVDNKSIHMEVIENAKTLDDGTKIIQLERAVGSAIKNFSNPVGINVPRARFLPVKKTADLLLVMSNLFTVRQGTLDMSPKRMFPEMPLIKLGDPHFTKVKEFLQRFDSIPDILELDHLTVSGNVTFGKNVVLRGTVIIIANHGDRIDIPAGAELENKIVTGNLRIVDH